MENNATSVLCTRPLNNDLITRAKNNGLTIETAVFIETEHIHTIELLAYLNTLSQENITAIFTSMNAVYAIKSAIKNPPQWNVFCLGGITRELAMQYFGEENIVATAPNATTLSEKILTKQTSTKTVFFCGDQRLDYLPEILATNGYSVEEVVVYKTIQTPKVIDDFYDAIIFFSPSAVHSFFSVNTIPINVVLFSIGKTTTSTIQSYCSNTIITSEWPGKIQMIELVISYLKKGS